MGVISIFGDRDSFWQSGQILYRVLEAFVLTEHRDRKTGQEDGTGGLGGSAKFSILVWGCESSNPMVRHSFENGSLFGRLLDPRHTTGGHWPGGHLLYTNAVWKPGLHNPYGVF